MWRNKRVELVGRRKQNEAIGSDQQADCQHRKGSRANESPCRCCAAGCSCYQLANGVIGCCPDGQSCSGSVDTAAVSTVTVYASYPVTTTVTSPNTVVVAGAPPATTVVTSNVDTVVVAGATTSVSESVIAAGGGYCSTLYADGPNLPTTRAGDCGTILVVNDAIALWGDAWVVLEVWAWIWVAVISILWLR